MRTIVIIGGGAAGFFSAIRCAELLVDLSTRIIILEKNRQVLHKVKISGGGRCNVTHACFEPIPLVEHYPRGQKALISPFHQFQPADTLEWFTHRGVRLKKESDGRIFPESNDSQTIVDCLIREAQNKGVIIETKQKVVDLIFSKGFWEIRTTDRRIQADILMMATGSNPDMWEILTRLGHRIVSPVPSLFTFKIKDERISTLMGISVFNTEVSIVDTHLKAKGPLMITHWGLSGPVILTLSAWGARILSERKYLFDIQINWLGEISEEAVFTKLFNLNKSKSRLFVYKSKPYDLPLRLWQKMLQKVQIPVDLLWADISKRQARDIAMELTRSKYRVEGQTKFKEEFVTCGGVSIKEIDFKTMCSKKYPHLFFGGEMLDIDALTGGFNFQAAWTTGWIAGSSIAQKCNTNLE